MKKTTNRFRFYFGIADYHGRTLVITGDFFDVLNFFSETVKNVKIWPNVLDIFGTCDVIADNFFSNYFFQKSPCNTPDITFINMCTNFQIYTLSRFKENTVKLPKCLQNVFSHLVVFYNYNFQKKPQMKQKLKYVGAMTTYHSLYKCMVTFVSFVAFCVIL